MKVLPQKEMKASSSVVDRARESAWPAIPVSEATSLVMEYSLEPSFKYVSIGAVEFGRVLAKPVIATCDIPAVRTSVMDGYAIIAEEGKGLRRVLGSSTAGHPFEGQVTPGTCVRISTGAAVPEGATAVSRTEDTRLVKHNRQEETEVEVMNEVAPGQHIRLPASDVRSGTVLLGKGCLIGPAEVGIISGSGQQVVCIYRKVKVCVMSTGNELVDCTTDELAVGQTRDTNRPQLMALFQSLGFKPIDAGIAGDTHEQLAESIRVAFHFSNILVTSGGVSMGEKDLLKEVLQKHFGFKIRFGRVCMKPGLPATFATGEFQGQKKLVFALPGNPVSSWVCSLLFAVPSMYKSSGREKAEHTKIRVQLGEQLRLDARPEYRRARLMYSRDGLPVAVTTGNQVSSRLMSVAGASLLLVLPPHSDATPLLERGTAVDALVVGTI